MIRFVALLLPLLLFCPLPAAAADWGPWEVPTHKGSSRQPEHDTSPFDQAVHFFQLYISPVDGPRCPMYPTCSAYSRQALARHGPWIGVMLTVDRLIHENDPREKRHPIRVGGRMRYADPVSNNDFWLESGPR
ncbi:membrane protein insertion efficiency factor YidD [Geothermobacter hydrogeniphilus]|uniref:Membrane protein insertion efficiency factor YidD n=1 Tax=Geothermobacter hydrogeniphilus TaxID=1969733 RepID=A0A2K2H8C7_9BACT|nr:membrane protein insertion efficiency factor YidD [Geothermobacter hydrogeniphilus]PNU19511.1 membrane protein insertion efficiency factor YidD [Geothermobacter hydrogeniphilus]